MPNELHERILALTASIGFNDGANKGFWRFQPREKFGEGAGQWIEMGAELRMFFKNKRGQTDSVTGKAVGSTGSPDGVRVLVQGQGKKGVPDGIYGADTANVRIAEGIIPEEVLEKQGIKNTPKITKEQEALLPSIDQLERADITDGDIRLINEGAKSAEAKQQAEYKKSVEAEEKKAAPKKTEAAKPQDDVKPTKPISLNREDVVRLDDGTEGTIVDLRFDNSMGGRSFMRIQTADGEIKTVDLKDTSQPVNVVKGKKGKISKPAKPTKPAAKPAPKAEEKPEAPAPAPKPEPTKPEPVAAEKPATKEKRPTLTKPENTLAPTPPPSFPPTNRVDDGSDIDMPELSENEVKAARRKRATPLLRPDGVPERYVDENGKLQVAEDPFSLMNVLAQVYPNAKFTKDGLNLILNRMTDKDGRIFELRASNAGQKTISYSMRWTDPNTGEVEELFHYDTRDSVQALFTKANGPDGLMDKILGRNGFEVLTNGKNWKRGPEATFRERARWFEQKQKMFTAEKLGLNLAAGPKTIYHSDERNYGRIKKTGNRSVWDAIDGIYSGNTSESLKDDIYLMLEQIMGSIPSTDRAHKALMVALRAENARRFGPRGNEDANKTVTALFTTASMRAKGKSFKKEKDPGFRANPYASNNRHTPLEEGMIVEYENNNDKTSILRIKSKHVNFSTVAGKDTKDIYNFGDFVEVVDSEGTVRTLASKELRILKDQNTALTQYIPNLEKEDLINYRVSTGKILPPEYRKISKLPGEGLVADKPEVTPEFDALVDDLIPGDDIYDENGNFLGEILAIEPTQDDDGNDGFAVLLSDAEGDNIAVFYPQGTAVSSAAEIPGVTTAKEPTEPDTEETVFYRMMAEDTPLSSSINPVPNASQVNAPVGEPAEDTGGRAEVSSSKEAIDKVLSRLLEALKNGNVPWRKPFTDDPRLAGASLPRNPKTKHIYTGTNAMVLRFVADLMGYEDGRWMSYKQAQDLGGQVRKGEKGTFILMPRIIPMKNKDGSPALDDKGKQKTFIKFNAEARFNVAQIDGLNLEDDVKNTDLQAKTPLEAQEFVLARYLKSMEALGLDVPKIRYTYVGEYGSHSSSPNWSPNSDVITLPTLEQFNSAEDIFDTLMHELAHSTGHPSRLDRTELTKDYGNPDGVARAKEELIAEISSALFQQMFGIVNNLDNSAAYVQSWLKRLQDNPEEIVKATKEAQKVVDYMLGIHLGDWSPVDGYTMGSKGKEDG